MAGIAGLPNFPGAGILGTIGVGDATGTNSGLQVQPDSGAVVSGFLLYSILAELRVQTQFLAVIANVPDQLSQLRADAITDMGAIYTTNPPTPVLSS